MSLTSETHLRYRADGARPSSDSRGAQKTEPYGITEGRAFPKGVWTGLARCAAERILDKNETASLHCRHLDRSSGSHRTTEEGRSPVDAQLELRVLRRLRPSSRSPNPHLLLLR